MSKFKKFIIYFVATGLGAGYAPLAPGTAGSLLALIIFWFFPLKGFIWIFICIIVFAIGAWASGQLEVKHGKDPGLAVIDEVVGQWLALIFLPHTLKIYFASFLIFRIFDIIKPFPAGRSQKLTGGLGIMMDDIIAGIYTNLIIQMYLYLFH